MRIVLDPDELNRFAAFVVEAADDHADCAARLRALDMPPMPPDVGSSVAAGIGDVARSLDALSTGLYGEALVLRARASALDPVLRGYLTQAFL